MHPKIPALSSPLAGVEAGRREHAGAVTGERYRLVEVNVARLHADLDSPQLAGFVTAVDGINLLAEASNGFVWRLRAAHAPVSILDDDPRLVVNLSVWESYESLHAFVYRSRHGGLVWRRADWFNRCRSRPPPCGGPHRRRAGRV